VFLTPEELAELLKLPSGETVYQWRRCAAPSRVHPWSASRTFAVRAGLTERFRAMVDAAGGCGLRQGEVFGLPADEAGFDSGWLHVGYQIKDMSGHLVFALPKARQAP
jgi:hypothetical protein